MVVHAGLAALLAKLGAGYESHRHADRRPSDQALDDLVGLFVNSLCCGSTGRRPDVRRAAGPRPRRRPGRVRPPGRAFERLVELVNPDRSLGRHPLFPVVLRVDSSDRHSAMSEIGQLGLSVQLQRVARARPSST